MNDWRKEIQLAVSDFREVAKLAGDPIAEAEIEIQFLPAPHAQPKCLPSGKMAIYGFNRAGRWLKIGKAGSNSQPRYCSQHYTGSARSTFRGSLMRDLEMAALFGSDPKAVRQWISKETNRVNILLLAERNEHLLSLLEAFLHVRLKPLYEG